VDLQAVLVTGCHAHLTEPIGLGKVTGGVYQIANCLLGTVSGGEAFDLTFGVRLKDLRVLFGVCIKDLGTLGGLQGQTIVNFFFLQVF
jgi:hypothetical protein